MPRMFVPESVTEAQLGCLAQIYTGQLGGMPWEILGTTYEVAGVVRAEIEIDENGISKEQGLLQYETTQPTTIIGGADNPFHAAQWTLENAHNHVGGNCAQRGAESLS